MGENSLAARSSSEQAPATSTVPTAALARWAALAAERACWSMVPRQVDAA